MRRAGPLIATLLSAAIAGTGCGSDKSARRDGAEGGPELALAKRTKKRPAQQDPNAGMKVDNELGVLETQDVEEVLQARFDDIRGCYRRAGKAQKYADGKVLLRFLVAGDGSADDVWVVESTLGSYDVERCLVAVGRRIKFPAPTGRKATTFDYPVEFRSTHQVAVLEVDGLKVETDVATFLPQLASCGQLAEEGAEAIIYIEPNGRPGSVGLAVGAAMDEDVADCMVQTIRGWKMSATLPGHVTRARFNIPPVIATAQATPPRRTAPAPRRRR